MLLEQRERRVVRQGTRDAAIAAGGVHRSPEGVEDGLLRGLDGRGEDLVELRVGHRLDLAPERAVAFQRRFATSRTRRRSRRCRGGRPSPTRARPRPQRRATRSSCAGPERRVGRDDDDAAPAGRARARQSGRRAPHRRARRRLGGLVPSRSSRARGRRPSASTSATSRLDVPIPAFQPNAIMPVPAPTHPSGDRAAGGRGERTAGVRGLDLHDARVVEPAVVAFADDRDDDASKPDRRIGRHGGRDRAVVDPSDLPSSRSGRAESRSHPIRGSARIPVSSPAPFEHCGAGRDRLCGKALRCGGATTR